jgi:SAM-dependent methyltransferase
MEFNRLLLQKALAESDSLSLAGQLDPSRSKISVDYQSGTFEDHYLSLHLFRFERAFFHLAAQKQLSNRQLRILDIGTSFIYHPEMKKIFPNSEFRYTSDDNMFNLESDTLVDADESFDLVILWEVIEHFYTDPMFALSEINRVLRPGGLLFVSTPNLASWVALLRIMNGQTPSFYNKYTLGHRRHVHEHVPSSIGSILNSAGFHSNVWTENVYYKDYGNLAMNYFRETGVYMENRGDTIFAMATKESGIRERYPRLFYENWSDEKKL